MYKLRQLWTEKYGWPLFKELQGVQANYPYQLFALTTNTISPLKDFITKFNLVLTEAINVSAIKNSGCEIPDKPGSINWLESYFKLFPYDSANLISCLRNLNTLRSKMTDAHIDSTEFESITIKSLRGFGIEAENLSWSTLDKKLLSRNIFKHFNEALTTLLHSLPNNE